MLKRVLAGWSEISMIKISKYTHKRKCFKIYVVVYDSQQSIKGNPQYTVLIKLDGREIHNIAWNWL